MAERVRIDKWLWAVRIFKTRSQATEACKKGRVSIGALPVKASRELQPGEVVKVKVHPNYPEFQGARACRKKNVGKTCC
jgi:ribosome-associated heat shock protein Hsp15